MNTVTDQEESFSLSANPSLTNVDPPAPLVRTKSVQLIPTGADKGGFPSKPKKPGKYPPGYGKLVWKAYSDGYKIRYGVDPVRNAKQSSLCCQLRDRLGEADSVEVAHYYPSTQNAFHVGRGHALDALVRDAEKIRTEWVTGNQVTQARAREGDRLQNEGDEWTKVIEEMCGDNK